MEHSREQREGTGSCPGGERRETRAPSREDCRAGLSGVRWGGRSLSLHRDLVPTRSSSAETIICSFLSQYLRIYVVALSVLLLQLRDL